VEKSSVDSIRKEVSGLVRVLKSTTVPVLWDLLSALDSPVVTAVSLNTEPRLEDVVWEDTSGVLSSVVGHEAEDEGVRSRLHQHTGEWSVEEVGVSLLLHIEAVASELSQAVQSDNTTGRVINQLLELASDSLVVVASLVKVGPCWRSIGFVLVVGTAQPVAQGTCYACLRDGWRATHGPAKKVTVEGATKN